MTDKASGRSGATWHRLAIGIVLALILLVAGWQFGRAGAQPAPGGGTPVLVYDREALFVRLREDFEERGDEALLRDPALADSIDQILDRAAADTGAVILDGQFVHRAPQSVDITEDIYNLLVAMQE